MKSVREEIELHRHAGGHLIRLLPKVVLGAVVSCSVLGLVCVIELFAFKMVMFDISLGLSSLTMSLFFAAFVINTRINHHEYMIRRLRKFNYWHIRGLDDE
jgi:hypothetical protein